MRLPRILILLIATPALLHAQGSTRFPMSRDSIVGRLADLQRIHTPEGIDEVEALDVNGAKEWIAIRGLNRSNPILLVLHGGPGSAMMGMSWSYQKPWEDFFTVVNWDQRGVGKNFNAADTARLAATMTVEQYVRDAEVVVRHVLKKLGQRKLVLMGYSFGTSFGPLLVQAHPELFHAWVGVGVAAGDEDGESGEAALYARVLQLAKASNDTGAIRALDALAPYPPHPFDVRKALAVRKYVRQYDGGWYGKPDFSLYFSLPDFGAAYDSADVAKVLPGISWSEALLASEASASLTPSLTYAVPVVYMQGRYDLHTPYETARRQFDQLQAPRKTFISFERSAHMIMWEEPGKFLMSLVTEVLPLAGGRKEFVVMPDPPRRR
ncbi:MAG: alpha/beta hydrolase [Gemmatimonadaceae bacterium]